MTPATAAPPALELPTAKKPAALDATSAKILLYGNPKVGKSTLAAGIDPDHTLFLACEPGLGALEVYAQPIKSWAEFRAVGPALATEIEKGSTRFRTVVIDTVDELAKFCQDKVMADLSVQHPSDLDWGKGWDAVTTEFKLRVGALASLGLGVWFISHAVDREVKRRGMAEITVTQPTVSGGPRKFLEGFCDYIWLAEIVQTEKGEHRQLRTNAGEHHIGGSRVTLPDPLALDPAAVTKALEAAKP